MHMGLIEVLQLFFFFSVRVEFKRDSLLLSDLTRVECQHLATGVTIHG